MGEVIRKDAAADDIISDVRKTLINARAKGGSWQADAEARLGVTDTLVTAVETRLRDARTELGPLQAAVDESNTVADKLLGRVSDDCWNLAGRPSHDPVFDVLFPGGIGYYADGDVTKQPHKMDLLAGLLESPIHPRIPADRLRAFAAEIRTASGHLRTAVNAASPVMARVELGEQMKSALARNAQIALSNLKRHWRADGKTEAEIHALIPDRPSTHGKKSPPGGGSSNPGSAPGAGA